MSLVLEHGADAKKPSLHSVVQSLHVRSLSALQAEFWNVLAGHRAVLHAAHTRSSNGVHPADSNVPLAHGSLLHVTCVKSMVNCADTTAPRGSRMVSTLVVLSTAVTVGDSGAPASVAALHDTLSSLATL
jgi:hypothetical protein